MKGFPIEVSGPKDAILLGAKGTSSRKTISRLTEAIIKDDYQGIMVWYATVKNGPKYSAAWDASLHQETQESLVDAMNKFKAFNIYG